MPGQGSSAGPLATATRCQCWSCTSLVCTSPSPHICPHVTDSYVSTNCGYSESMRPWTLPHSLERLCHGRLLPLGEFVGHSDRFPTLSLPSAFTLVTCPPFPLVFMSQPFELLSVSYFTPHLHNIASYPPKLLPLFHFGPYPLEFATHPP